MLRQVLVAVLAVLGAVILLNVVPRGPVGRDVRLPPAAEKRPHDLLSQPLQVWSDCDRCFSGGKRPPVANCIGCEVWIRKHTYLEARAALHHTTNHYFGLLNMSVSNFTGVVSDRVGGKWIVSTHRGVGAYAFNSSMLVAMPSMRSASKPKEQPVCFVVAGVEGTGHHALDALFEAHQNESLSYSDYADHPVWRTKQGLKGVTDYTGLPASLVELNGYFIDRRPMTYSGMLSTAMHKIAKGIERIRRERPRASVIDVHFFSSYPAGLVNWGHTPWFGWGPVMAGMQNIPLYRDMMLTAHVHRMAAGFRPDLPALAKASAGRCHLRVLVLRRTWEPTIASMVLRRSRVPIRSQVKTIETELIVLSQQLKALAPEQWVVADYDALVKHPGLHVDKLARFLCVPQLAANLSRIAKRVLKPPRKGTREQFNDLEREYIEELLSDERGSAMWPAILDDSRKLMTVSPLCP
eukprot:TRINITY_DN17019_c0_g1_i1.p1 TRINITY_DN17019_c0_g1~~TRINITY_DN17019_c0_g1_i1.p1  ORF type:complete len:465 (+),score=132.32 TRINITY_DN17019_c0_g1_i1:49-1443(+)